MNFNSLISSLLGFSFIAVLMADVCTMRAEAQDFGDVYPSTLSQPPNGGVHYSTAVETLFGRGVTSGSTGCTAYSYGGLVFCPTDPVTRAQASVFIIRAVYSALNGDGESFSSGGPYFNDVPNDPSNPYYPYYRYINRMYELGLTSGCSTNPLMFCPGSNFQNEELAIFIVKAEQTLACGGCNVANQLPDCSNGLCSSPTYNDVPTTGPNAWFHDWVIRAANYVGSPDVTAFCPSPGNFCTGSGYTAGRGQTAIDIYDSIWNGGSVRTDVHVRPAIGAIAPIAGPVGTTVTITGAGFGSSMGSVAFNGTPAGTISSWSASAIVVVVPTGAITGSISVTAGGSTSSSPAQFIVSHYYNQAATGVNLGSLPIDMYDGNALNFDPQQNSTIIANCPSTQILRECIRGFLKSWQSQGVTGLRFTIGMSTPIKAPDGSQAGDRVASYFASSYLNGGTPAARDGGYSHPWLWTGTQGNPTQVDTSGWQDNLTLFLEDAKYSGMAISPTLEWFPNNGTLTSSVLDCTQTQQLAFYPWVPYGFLSVDGKTEDCTNSPVAEPYMAAAQNPFSNTWGGWQPFQNMTNAVASAITSAKVLPGSPLTMRELEVEQERNLFSRPVQARLIYDNKAGFDVLGYIRGAVSGAGFLEGIVTMSTIPQYPSVDPGPHDSTGILSSSTCPSVYNDGSPSPLFTAAELMHALKGDQFGGFSLTVQHNEICGGTFDGSDSSLPVTYTSLPSVLDVHAYPCITIDGYPADCDNSQAAQSQVNTAQSVYDSVLVFLGQYSMAAPIMGESSVIDFAATPDPPCGATGLGAHMINGVVAGGLPTSGAGASWAIQGYESSYLSSTRTVLQPFNNPGNACYTNPLNVVGSAYWPGQ